MRLAWRAGILGMVIASFACGNGDDSSTGPTGSAGKGGGSTGGAGGSSTGGNGGSGGSGGSRAGSGGSSAGQGGNAGTAGAAGNAGSGGSANVDAGADARDASIADARDAQGERDVSSPDAADGALPYDPCPPKGMPCVILPVGDSITQGAPNPPAGGYRAPLFHLARMNMQTITFVGSGADGPATVDGVAFPRNHEGHSGYNIDNTQGRMGVRQFFPAAITTYKPHIVTLMIGTNDVDTGEDDIPGRLGTLMDTILNADTKLLLVVAQIVPQQKADADTKNMQVEAYNGAIPALVKARADAGKHVVMVDMYNAFTSVPNYSSVLLADRLHPTPQGFTVMANTWYAAIRNFLR